MILLDDIAYCLAIWFVEGPHGNVLAIVYRDHAGEWQGVYRFRHFGPSHGRGTFDPFADDDRKSFYTIRCDKPDPERHLVDAMDDALSKLISIGYGGKLQKLPVNGDGRAAREVLMKQPWCHAKWESKNEETDAAAGRANDPVQATSSADERRRARNRRKAERRSN